jgi:hypothetical protein
LAEVKSRLKEVEKYIRRLGEKVKKLEEDPPSKKELLAENIKQSFRLGRFAERNEEFAGLE